MSNALALQTTPWQMSIVSEQYDRSPLAPQENNALMEAVRLGESARGHNQTDYAREELRRFQKPMYDVIALRTSNISIYQRLRRILYLQMIQRNTSLWEWSKQEWIEIICPTKKDFERAYGRPGSGRFSLRDMAYLLGGVTDLREVGQKLNSWETARLYFGPEVVEQEGRRVTDCLVGQAGQGYHRGPYGVQGIRQALGLLFLLNRRPFLEDISPELLQMASQDPDALASHQVVKVKVALHHLGLFEQRPELHPVPKKQVGDLAGVPVAWAAWCDAWLRRQAKVSHRVRVTYNQLLCIGRWLADQHPEIASPEQWDEELALEYVSYLCSRATVGDYASAQGNRANIALKRVGKPLAPRTMKHRLAALIRFFTDLQEKPHQLDKGRSSKLERRFNPHEVFRLPRSIKRLIQPDPREIDEVIWCKLTYAAATLTEEDYHYKQSHYPLTYYRAAALLWVTSARRPGEITRLQVGCIRRDWDPDMLDEEGSPLPGQEAQLCYLYVPVNKTKGAFWVPIPRYTADAVETWERERPSRQPRLVDEKDSSLVNFLFCLRGRKMGEKFINQSLIPALCRRAGISESDARGAITGHRARSTIATMLRRNGLSLEDIAQFLGHSNTKMVRAYARTDPFRFGRDMNRANDLMRIVEGIIDTRAAKAGQPNVFFFLGRGSDGQPRFCGNPAWDKCKHRLACLKCPMYVGAGQASRLAERLEARDELFKFQTKIEMIPQEQAAVEGDIEKLTELIQADADVPPPDLPNEQFRFSTSPPPPTDATSPNETQTDLVTLARELTTLSQELAEVEQRVDGRNARVRALKKRIAAVTEQMAVLDQVAGLSNAQLGT